MYSGDKVCGHGVAGAGRGRVFGRGGCRSITLPSWPISECPSPRCIARPVCAPAGRVSRCPSRPSATLPSHPPSYVQLTLYLRLLAEYPASKTATGVEVTVPLPRSVQRVHCETGACLCAWSQGPGGCVWRVYTGGLGSDSLLHVLPLSCAATAAPPHLARTQTPPTSQSCWRCHPTNPTQPDPTQPNPTQPHKQMPPMSPSCWRCPARARLSRARSGGSASASWCGASRT